MAVVDLETTGLSPGGDRIVEIAVVRIEPGQQPVLVLDTLVNPGLPISGTEIHGISDKDVIEAPSFIQVAGNLASALTDSVFASYNVYFDFQFVQAELTQVGINNFPPHLCLMYMRPLLGLGPKCSLTDACEAHGITYSRAHQAASDAMVGAFLWQAYVPLLATRGIRTFGDLAKLKAYKFTKSFSESLLDRSITTTLQSASRLKSRTQDTRSHTERQLQVDRTYALAEYWDALTAALADLTVTPAEIHYLQEKRRALSLTVDEVRGFHARVFSRILADLSQDKVVTPSQAQTLQGITVALRQLGWEPGDSEEELILSAPTETIVTRPQERSIWDTLTSWFRPRKSMSTTPYTLVPLEQASGKITPTTRSAGTKPYIIVPLEQGSLTWLEWRGQGIGASDAPIVMGEISFRSAEELLREKQASFEPGLIHDFGQNSAFGQDNLVRDFDQNSTFRQNNLVRDFSQKSAMAQGTELEPVARGLYIATTGREVYPVCLQSTRYEWLRASLDGLAINHDAVVEIKCGRSAYRIAAQTRSVPKYYYGQVQHILAVTGLESLDFWCYWPGYPPLLITVPRDAAYIERLLKTEMEFWTRVQQNI
ncbi:MAG: lambda-exonuclease family protein [Candidatus Binatia bacterium]